MIANVFCNMSIGFFTGFIILIITNQKNKYVYQNNLKIEKIKKIITEIRNYEIKIIKLPELGKIGILELTDIYYDLLYLLESIKDININYFENYNFKELVDDYNSCIAKLSKITNKLCIGVDEYKMHYEEDLAKKMRIMYTLGYMMKKDLDEMEKDNSELNSTIL